jgi:ubiquinone/menaquinone biosynthesis C-methylase UbiE
MTKRGYFFIGIDYSVSALMYLKKKLKSKGISSFLLIHTDICNLGVNRDCVDLIYGGGSLEHFKNTQQAVNHLYRVLRTGGTSYNVVPYLNLGNIVYRSQWGSIPNFPVLKQLSELIHIKILGAKYMIFGYEMQFSKHSLKKWHMKSGFKEENIKMGRFITKVQIHLIKIPVIKKFFIYLCEHSEMFWPAIYVAATK